MNPTVEQAREMEETWRLEEEERERQEGHDGRDARRGVDGVTEDMNAFLAWIHASLSSPPPSTPLRGLYVQGRSHARFLYLSFL